MQMPAVALPVEATTTEVSAQTSNSNCSTLSCVIVPVQPDGSECCMTNYQGDLHFKNDHGHANVPPSGANKELVTGLNEQQHRSILSSDLPSKEAPVAAASEESRQDGPLGAAALFKTVNEPLSVAPQPRFQNDNLMESQFDLDEFSQGFGWNAVSAEEFEVVDISTAFGDWGHCDDRAGK